MCGYHCDEKHAPTEYMLKEGFGCSICGGGNAVQKGINDISTSAPWMMKYFYNQEDGYTHSIGCRKKIKFQCPDCGYVTEKIIANVYNQGFSCPRCDDGYSYPEKFMISLLEQLNIEYKFQVSNKVLPWCEKYKYDFLIPSLKLIIETDGEQHSCNKGVFNVSVEEQQEIDRKKIELANNNGYQIIHIDCRKSKLDFIKNNIIHSELSKYFNFDNINWIECNNYGLKSIVKEICDYFDSYGDITTGQIAKKYKINVNTVRSYLLIGNEYSWCNYDPKYIKKICQKSHKKPLEAWYQNEYLGKFKEAAELVDFAKDKYGIQLARNQISQCCNGKIHTTKGFVCKYI